jgi:rod shape-determining protein MreD
MKLNLRKITTILISFLIAAILMMLPYPKALHWLRPEWVALVLIYWAFRVPESVGVIPAWCVGLVMDIVTASPLGQYALSMTIIVYLAHFLKNRMKHFPRGQQALVIFMLIGIGQLVVLGVQWLIGHPPASLWFWASTVVSMLMWPWIYRLMRMYERKAL